MPTIHRFTGMAQAAGLLFSAFATASGNQATPAPSERSTAQPAPEAPRAPPPESPAEMPVPVTERLRASAALLVPLVTNQFAKDFLAATSRLVEPSARTIYRNREKGSAVSGRAFGAMGPDEQAGFKPFECSPDFYYETAYGSPLVYVRLLDLASPHLPKTARPKVLDFGYGSIGQLQLLAHCGYEAHGVDVEPVFKALYSEASDVGAIGPGSVAIHTGQWPAEEGLRAAVGGGCSLITSKNTLKKGYVHPSPPAGQTVDPKRLVHLGVTDEQYLREVHAALVPGGVFVIYNICPPQNPPDKEYIPYADGDSPFTREAFERAGFEVLAYNEVDQAWVLDCFGALGYLAGKPREEAAKDFFCWYTIARRRE